MNLLGQHSGPRERFRIADRLEAAANVVERENVIRAEHVRLARALIAELRSKNPPPIEDILERGRGLFARPRGAPTVEIAETRPSHVDFSSVDVVRVMQAGGAR